MDSVKVGRRPPVVPPASKAAPEDREPPAPQLEAAERPPLVPGVRTEAPPGFGLRELTLADDIARQAVHDTDIGNNVGYTGGVGRFVRWTLGMDGHHERAERADRLVSFMKSRLAQEGYHPDADKGSLEYRKYARMMHLTLANYEMSAFLDASAPQLARKLDANIALAKQKEVGDVEAALATKAAVYAHRKGGFDALGELLDALGLSESAVSLAPLATRAFTKVPARGLGEAFKGRMRTVTEPAKGTAAEAGAARNIHILGDGSPQALLLEASLEPFQFASSRHVVVAAHWAKPYHNPEAVEFLARTLRQEAPGRPVQLVVCSGGESGMAQSLANELGVPVKAYFGEVFARHARDGALRGIGGEAHSAQMFWPRAP